MRQTISGILQGILRGRPELHTLLHSARTIDILMSLFLLGITVALTFTVFHKFKSPTSVKNQRHEKDATNFSPERKKKDRPFGGV